MRVVDAQITFPFVHISHIAEKLLVTFMLFARKRRFRKEGRKD
jgi:hypothetical protein